MKIITTLYKWLTIICFFFATNELIAQTTIWSENFESYADNTTNASNNNTDNGSIDWSTSGTAWGYFRVENDLAISGNNSFVQYASYYGETVWTTESVDISSYSNVSVSMDYNEYGDLENSDDILIQYELNGSGTWTTLGNGSHSDDMSGSETASTTNLNGNSIRLRVTAFTSWSSEYWYFDNVLIQGTTSAGNCNPCYSVSNGDMDDSNTWSNTSGGASGYSPSNNGWTDFVIEGGNIVNLNTDFQVRNLTIGNIGTGTLNWSGNNVELDVENGGTISVASGSKIDENGYTDAAIYFSASQTYSLTVNDITNGIEVDDIFIENNATVNMTGSGKMQLNNGLYFTGDDATFSSSISSFSVINDITLNADVDRNHFTNSGTMTIGGRFFYPSDANNCELYNNGTMNITGDLHYEDVGFAVTDSYAENNGTFNIGADLFFGNDNCQMVNNGTLTITDELFYGGNSDYCYLTTGTSSTTTILNRVFFQEETGPGTTNNHIVNGGTFFVANAIYCDLFGVTITNQVTGTMAVGNDIFQNVDNLDVINAGTMSLVDFELNDNGDEMDVINSGTLNFGNVRAANGDLDITNTGTINQSGTFVNGQIDGDAYFTNSTNGQWNYEGTSHDNSTLLDCSATDNTFTYLRTGNQDMINAVSNIYYHLEITVSGTKTTADDLDINGNLTIANTAILDPVNDDISIAGNWINTSSNGFTEGSDNVTFDGTNNQTITCSTIGTETFHNLSINKSNGSLVTLNNPVSLTNTGILNFNGSNGYLVLNGNDFMIPNWTNGDITGFDTNEFIVVDGTGFIKYDGVTNGEVIDIPMGLSTGTTNYSLAVLTMSDPGNNTFDANMCGQVQLDGGLCDGTAISLGVVGQTWNFVSTSTNANVKLYWDTSSEASFDRTNCSVIHFDGSSWEDFGFGNATSEGGSLYSRSATTTGFSPFSIQDNSIILPVSLLDFSAQNIENTIEVNWATISEIENAFFAIEKSIDGVNFETIATIQGQGNSNISNQYSVVDKTPYQGISYYRLKQTDYNGQTETFKLVKVFVGSNLETKIYPNPITNNKISVDILGDFEQATIQVYNELGMEIINQLIKEENHFEIEFDHHLSTGYYFVLLHINNEIIKHSLVVE